MSQSLQKAELKLTHAQAAYHKIAKRIPQAHQNSESLDKIERELVAEVMNLGHACLQDFISAAGDGDVGKQIDNDLLDFSRIEERSWVSAFIVQ